MRAYTIHLSQVSVSTWYFSVRMHYGDLDIRQYLPTLHESHAVRGTSLQHRHSVHPQTTLVHVHIGRLGVLGTLEEEEEEEQGDKGLRNDYSDFVKLWWETRGYHCKLCWETRDYKGLSL